MARFWCRFGLPVVVAIITGCSPVLDWRESRLDPQGAVALFPCKPELRERKITEAGKTLQVAMQSCEAGGMNFALMTTDAGSDELAAALSTRWAVAVFDNIAAAEPAARLPPPRLRDGTSNAQHWQARGREPGGSALTVEIVTIVRNGRVFEMAVTSKSDAYGPGLADATTAFWEGLTLR